MNLSLNLCSVLAVINDMETIPYPLYYRKSAEKLMFKQISDTVVILLQIEGRDLSKHFHHKHETVTYPNAERLQEDVMDMEPGTADDWEDLMNEYLQVNKEKLRIMSAYRQRLYDEGKPLR